MSVSKKKRLELVARLATFGPAYMRWVAQCLPEPGVSYARLRLLATLHEDGPQIMASLKTRLGVTAQNITALVDALELEGFVERRAHDFDRRAIVISLSERGNERVQADMDEHRQRVAGIFEGLSSQQADALIDALNLVAQALARRLP
jgi:DNA-binding MarR family transcriptional regulator